MHRDDIADMTSTRPTRRTVTFELALALKARTYHSWETT